MSNVIKMSKPVKLLPQQLKQIDRIAELLTNMGCEFRIRTPEGHGFDNILVPNRGKNALSLNSKKASVQIQNMRKHGIKKGDIKAYLDPLLRGMKLGEVRIVKTGKFDFLKSKFANHISAHLCHNFGKGLYSVSWEPKDESFLVHYHGGV